MISVWCPMCLSANITFDHYILVLYCLFLITVALSVAGSRSIKAGRRGFKARRGRVMAVKEEGKAELISSGQEDGSERRGNGMSTHTHTRAREQKVKLKRPEGDWPWPRPEEVPLTTQVPPLHFLVERINMLMLVGKYCEDSDTLIRELYKFSC